MCAIQDRTRFVDNKLNILARFTSSFCHRFLKPSDYDATERSAEQLLSQASESINVSHEGQGQVFDEVMIIVMAGVNTCSLHAEPLSQFVHDCLIFLETPERSVKRFMTSAVQILLKFKGRKEVTVASTADAAQLHDNGQTAHSAF